MRNGETLARDLALAGGRAVEQGVRVGIDGIGRLGGLALNVTARGGMGEAQLRAVGAGVEMLHHASPAVAQAAGRFAALSLLVGGRGLLATGRRALFPILRFASRRSQLPVSGGKVTP